MHTAGIVSIVAGLILLNSVSGRTYGDGLVRSAAAGGVSATAEPVSPTHPAAQALDFKVALDTHSVNLGFDMLKIATLRDDTGAEVAPTGWTGGKGGHHLSGVLSFPSGKLAGATSLTLDLKGAGGGKDLVFIWTGPLGMRPSGREVRVTGGSYYSVGPAQLAAMLETKDFFLVNTHVPYEGEIPSTDAFIPYDRTLADIAWYPRDKSAKIVVYCRSGHMSDSAARELVKQGYTNVMDLDGGMIAWQQAGYRLTSR